MAGGDRAMIKPGLSIDEVLYCLDDAQADDKKAAGKYGAVKKIFNQTLQCIQTIGGIVADGASQVCIIYNLPAGPLLIRCAGVPASKHLLQCLDLRDSGLERIRGNLRESSHAAGEVHPVSR